MGNTCRGKSSTVKVVPITYHVPELYYSLFCNQENLFYMSLDSDGCITDIIGDGEMAKMLNGNRLKIRENFIDRIHPTDRNKYINFLFTKNSTMTNSDKLITLKTKNSNENRSGF